MTLANQNTSTGRGLRTSGLDTFPFLGIQVGLFPSGFHYISRQFHLLDLYALVKSIKYEKLSHYTPRRRLEGEEV
jgi:hypothetical protein